MTNPIQKTLDCFIAAATAAVQDQLAKLEAENEALREQNTNGLAVLRTQREQLDCYIKDAERYRWLRDKSLNHRGSYSPIPVQQNPDGSIAMPLMPVTEWCLDEDIDAAMSEEVKS